MAFLDLICLLYIFFKLECSVSCGRLPLTSFQPLRSSRARGEGERERILINDHFNASYAYSGVCRYVLELGMCFIITNSHTPHHMLTTF